MWVGRLDNDLDGSVIWGYVRAGGFTVGEAAVGVEGDAAGEYQADAAGLDGEGGVGRCRWNGAVSAAENGQHHGFGWAWRGQISRWSQRGQRRQEQGSVCDEINEAGGDDGPGNALGGADGALGEHRRREGGDGKVVCERCLREVLGVAFVAPDGTARAVEQDGGKGRVHKQRAQRHTAHGIEQDTWLGCERVCEEAERDDGSFPVSSRGAAVGEASGGDHGGDAAGGKDGEERNDDEEHVVGVLEPRKVAEVRSHEAEES
jgi:hypothetical protein